MRKKKKHTLLTFLYLSALLSALGVDSPRNLSARTNEGYDQKAFADDSPPANLITLDFVDKNTGWLAGRLGLFRTRDGGKAWSRIGPDIAIPPHVIPSPFALGTLTPILWIDFVSDRTGWALRCDGLINTTDGGDTWTTIDDPLRFYQFSFFDDRNGWAFAHDGFVYHSTDGGKFWTRQVRGGPVRPVSVTECWALGTRAEVLHTKDAGANWLSSKVSTSERLLGPPVVTEKKVWVRTRREVYSSDDGGLTWQSVLQLSKGDPDIDSIAFPDELNGWIVGNRGMILHTRDGGKNWTKQNGGVSEGITAIAAIDQLWVWLLTDERVLKTSDGGRTWVPQSVTR